MKTKKQLILSSLIGLSLSAQAHEVKVGIPLVKREDIFQMSKDFQFEDLEIELLETGILKEYRLREHYVVDPNRLREEISLSINAEDLETYNLLRELDKERITVSIQRFEDMMATTQDFSPLIQINADRLRERIQNGRFKRVTP